MDQDQPSKSAKRPARSSRASAELRAANADRKGKTEPKAEPKVKAKHKSKPQSDPGAATADHHGWSDSVMQFVRNLFVRQVGLKRKGGDLHLVLRDPPSEPPRTAPVPVPSSASEASPTHAALLGISSAQLKRMRHQLEAVLDLHPNTRSVFPHLNYLNKSLRRHGADCFRDLPVEVLHKALKQLDSLVQNTSPGPVGLAELRACLVVSAVDRGTPETEADGHGEPSGLSSSLSDFNAGGKLSIHEVSHSDFMKANQQWQASEELIKLAKS